jgi:hypothetical protein
MNIIKCKLINVKRIGAMVLGGLFNEVLVVNAAMETPTRDEVIEWSCSGEMAPKDIRRISPKVFGEIEYSNAYELIFGNCNTQCVLSPAQIGAVPPLYSDCMFMHKLNKKQCQGLRLEQLRALGSETSEPLNLKETEELKKRLNFKQREALKIAEARALRMRKLFTMVQQPDGNQEKMIDLVTQGISLCQKNESKINLFCAACLAGKFDLALYLLDHESACNYITDSDGRIMLLKLKNFLNGEISESDREKIENLMSVIRPYVFRGWQEKKESVFRSPSKLSDYCKKIDVRLQKRQYRES